MGMAQAQTQTQEQIMDMFEEMTEEEIKAIVMDIIKNPEKYPEERRFLLTISEDTRPGGAFVRYNRFKILYGDAEAIEMNHIYDYPYTDETQYILIPRTKVVIVLEESYDETKEPIEEHKVLHIYVFPKGWQVIKLY